jgi:hypothetical protein
MNGKWSKENFIKFDQENPRIWELFRKYTNRARIARDKYSAKAIFHRIRWEEVIERRTEDFKIDDGWISHYARKYMDMYPQSEGFFEIRTRRNSYHN